MKLKFKSSRNLKELYLYISFFYNNVLLLWANLEDYLPLLSVFALQHTQFSFSLLSSFGIKMKKKSLYFVTGSVWCEDTLQKYQTVLGNMAQTSWLILLLWFKVTQRRLGRWSRFGGHFCSSVWTENWKHATSAWNKQINRETFFSHISKKIV